MNTPNLLLTLSLAGLVVFPTGTTLAADRVRVLRTPGEGSVPDAETGRSGTVHVAYVAGEDAFYARSTNEGASFSQPIRVNSQVGTVHPAGDFRGPDLALGQDDAVHVIWYANSYQRKRPKDEWGVYYSRLEANGSAFIPSLNLNHQPSDNYSLAAGSQGQVAVFWMAEALYLNASRDGGASFATAVKVTPADTCECCASRASFGVDGTLFCAYRDKAANERDMYLLARRPGASSWSRAKASGAPWVINGCPMTGTYLAAAGSGLVMAWETKGVISFARFDSTGRMQGQEFTVPGAGGKFPIVLAAPDGMMCVSWKKGSTLHWVLLANDGRTVSETKSQPSPNPHRHAGAVTKGGSFLLID